MSETRHSPGPWTIDRNGNIRTGNRFYFQLWIDGAGAPEPEWTANRNLAAAAPAMLEACEAALTALEGAVLSHSRGCAAVLGIGECDCWLSDRVKALYALRAALLAARPTTGQGGEG